MLYSYAHLRGAAIAARSAVLDAYRKEETEAARLMARLESYAHGKQPLQDDEGSLVQGLEQLIGASTTTPTKAYQGIAKTHQGANVSSRPVRVPEICDPA